MVGKAKDNELRITRVYDAPISVVWNAWTEPDQVAQWWGPRGFTLTTHSKELRVGGIWHYTMHGPDGTDYPNKTKYLEVIEGSKLVYDHGGYDDKPPLFRVTVHFSESSGKTTMEMTMTLPTPEAARQTREFVKKAGGDSTWDRLAEFLTNKLSGNEKFVINRTFAAGIDTVYAMWTDPEHLSRWLPPTGFEMKFQKVDIRTGGEAVYSMSNNSGVEFYGRTSYLAVDEPTLISYTQQFCDKEGNVSRHPLAPVWPQTMLTVVSFFPEYLDETRVTVVWEPHGETSASELAAFVKSRAGMTQGWSGSFDKLEEALTALR